MAERDNYYDVLGVAPNATAKDIKKAYRTLSKSLHPDKNKFGTTLFKRINEAHSVLSNPLTRAVYDRDPNAVPSRNDGENGNTSHTSTQHPWKDTILKSLTCPVCRETIQTRFVEMKCCGCLCCAECIEKKYQMSCPNNSCEKSFGSNNSFTRKPTKFVQHFVKTVALAHECGRFVLLEDLERHGAVCLATNTVCFRCSGRGYKQDHRSCNGCRGLKVLPGKGWRKCFKCKGSGVCDDHNDQSIADSSTTTVDCSTCEGVGGLQGKWTICFKCQGSGKRQFNHCCVDCDACACSGALLGYHLEECSSCKGYGCKTCDQKGSVRCSCGASCKGHSSNLTPRHTYLSYESDSSIDESDSIQARQ